MKYLSIHNDHIRKGITGTIIPVHSKKPIHYPVVFRTLILLSLAFNIALQAQNLVLNGSFEQGDSNWVNLAQDSSNAASSISSNGPQDGNRYLSVDVLKLGTNPWSVQTISAPLSLIKNNGYRLSFYAKSNVPGKKIRAVLQNATYSARDFALTDAWVMYTWDFTSAESLLSLKFHYFQTGTFSIDNISLRLYSAANTPPSCVITTPHVNSYFRSGSNVIINVYSTDVGGTAANGTVAKVEFFNGNTKIGETASGIDNVYTCIWKNVPIGTYTIKAKATDNLGAASISAGVVIQVGPSHAQQIGLSAGKGKYLANINGFNRSDFKIYWNGVTAENSCKWGSVEGTRDVMNWKYADSAYLFSRDNHLMFRYHALAWGSQYPQWITSLSPDDFKTQMEEYIAAVAARYPYIDQIDVLNEQLGSHAGGTPYFRDGLGGTGETGYDWQIWLFAKARQYFPNSKLILNDYGLVNDANAIKEQLKLIAALRDRGLIDGFGTQSHWFNIDKLSAATLKSNLNLMASGGIPIYVTELDIKGSGIDTTQLKIYQNIFPVYWENPDVAGITLWGYVEGQTWVTGSWLINKDGSERPAMKWLETYMNGCKDVGYPFGKEVNHAPTDILVSSLTVEENKPGGTIIGTFSTSDPDSNDTFTYSLVAGIGDTDNVKFTISDTVLLLDVALDYEWAPTRTIRVRVTDQGGLSFEKIFTITLIDVDDYTVKTADEKKPDRAFINVHKTSSLIRLNMGKEVESVKVMDISGAVVESFTGINHGHIDLGRNYSQGMYIVRINGRHKNEILKFIKSR